MQLPVVRLLVGGGQMLYEEKKKITADVQWGVLCLTSPLYIFVLQKKCGSQEITWEES